MVYLHGDCAGASSQNFAMILQLQGEVERLQLVASQADSKRRMAEQRAQVRRESLGYQAGLGHGN